MGSLANPMGWLKQFLGISGSTRVNEQTALEYPPCWYALQKITGAILQMRIEIFRKSETGRELATSHPAYYAVSQAPNFYQDPAIWITQMLCHYLLWGDARSVIYRGLRSTELIPLLPQCTATYMEAGEKWHATKPDIDDPINLFEAMADDFDDTLVFRDRDVLHVPNLSCCGVTGRGVLEVGSRSLSIGIDHEKYQQKALQKGFQGRAVLEAPPGAFRDKVKAEEFVEKFRQKMSGEDADDIGMLRDGVKLTMLAHNARDSQLIESRIHQRQDTAMLFMLESIIGDDTSVSYNSLQQKNLSWMQTGLGPILTRFEQQMDRKLLTDRQRRAGSHYFRFNRRALMETTFNEKAQTLLALKSGRLLTTNECREELDRNNIAGGDVLDNPNIDPVDKQPAEDPPEQQDPPDDADADKLQAAIRGRLQPLLKAEAQRIHKAATSGDFPGWLRTFYEGWQTKLQAVCIELQADPDIAERYCQSHRRELLELHQQGLATEAFKAEIAATVELWDTDDLTAAILGGD